MKVISIERTVQEVCQNDILPNVKDPAGLVAFNAGRKAAYAGNPMLCTKQTVAQIIGVCGSEVIGRLNVFPLEVVADGKILSAVCGDSLFVREEFRSTLYGISLMNKLNNITPDRLSLSAGFSPKARHVIRVIKDVIFPLRKFMTVRRTRGILPTLGRFGWVVHISCLLDLLLWPYNFLTRIWVKLHLRGLAFKEIDIDDADALKQFAEMIRKDKHRFRENMSEQILSWIVHNDFILDRLMTKRIIAYRQDNRFVAFAMIREGRTPTELKLGNVIEWQCVPDLQNHMRYMLLDAMQRSLDHLDCVVVEMGPLEARQCCFADGYLPALTLGSSVVSIGLGKGSSMVRFEGYDDVANWRLRGAMGDLCFF